MIVKQIVGVADMKISRTAGDVLVTHALGSCLGVAVYDPVAVVGGLLHVMMPQASINPEKAQANPFMFVDSGVPAFFQQLYAVGAHKARCILIVAGGSNVNGGDNDRFAIGKRNYLMLRKLLWKNGVLVTAEDVGGTAPRTMYLEIGTGKTWLSTAGQELQLR
jgi:chemotaxis protein CheD